MAKTSLSIWLVSVLAAFPVLFITNVTSVVMKDGSAHPVCKTPITETWHKVSTDVYNIVYSFA
jgi:hypothetical protein